MAQQGIWVDVQGLKDLQSQLKQLPEKVKKTELYRILRNVTGPVEDAMKAEVTKIEMDAMSAGRNPTGNLYDAIGRIRGKSKDFVNMQVAPRAKGKYKGGHAHLVHFGTKNRKTKKGWSRGAGTSNPFAERAFRKSYSMVKPKFESEIAKSTEKLIKKNIIPTA